MVCLLMLLAAVLRRCSGCLMVMAMMMMMMMIRIVRTYLQRSMMQQKAELFMLMPMAGSGDVSGASVGEVKNQMADIGRLLSIFLAKPMNFSAQLCGTWLDMFCMLGAIVNLEAQSEQNFLNFWLSIAFDCVRFKSPCQHVLTVFTIDQHHRSPSNRCIRNQPDSRRQSHSLSLPAIGTSSIKNSVMNNWYLFFRVFATVQYWGLWQWISCICKWTASTGFPKCLWWSLIV